jgi:hypothetical protein
MRTSPGAQTSHGSLRAFLRGKKRTSASFPRATDIHKNHGAFTWRSQPVHKGVPKKC